MDMSNLPANIEQIIDSFESWFSSDPHSQNEDAYASEITRDTLENLSQDEFISFFDKFAREGGQLEL